MHLFITKLIPFIRNRRLLTKTEKYFKINLSKKNSENLSPQPRLRSERNFYDRKVFFFIYHLMIGESAHWSTKTLAELAFLDTR